ncbi:tenascin [Drosophila busckii]|nr:tenascin [Drosophila busckii]
MSPLLRALGRQTCLLLICLCLLDALETQYEFHEQQVQQRIIDEQHRLHQQQMWLKQQREAQDQLRRYSSTTSTRKPYIMPQGLSLPQRGVYPEKCYREVPAVFFQVDKQVKIVGNSTNNRFFNVIEVCCKGWRRYEYDWSRCVPDCGERCRENGFCLPGGICKCFDDFVLNYRNNCVPTCPLGCPHGQCYLNGTCRCDKGFELDGSRKFCQPQCNQTCSHNEICLEPGKCVCAEGYARGLRESNVMGCQPMCVPDCGYGHCVAPNQCECFPGYQKRLNRTSCEANSYLRCENGFCANRTHCVCQNGYRFDLNTTSCLPDCGYDCDNGVCISPGNCRCFNGYERKRQRCEAICERGCGFYGTCIAPNVCGCARVQGPESSYQNCELGYCNGEGHCRCLEGKTRFIDKCMSPDSVTTYASQNPIRVNASLIHEFDLLLGRYFVLGSADWYWGE